LPSLRYCMSRNLLTGKLQKQGWARLLACTGRELQIHAHLAITHLCVCAAGAANGGIRQVRRNLDSPLSVETSPKSGVSRRYLTLL
jgi:hypothetical protein